MDSVFMPYLQRDFSGHGFIETRTNQNKRFMTTPGVDAFNGVG